MRKKHRNPDTLASLKKKGDIDSAEFEAGRRFQEDFISAGYVCVRGIDYDRVGGGEKSISSPTEIAVMNGFRVRRVMERLGGMDCVLGRAAWNVLGLEKSIAEWAVSEGYDAREAKGALLGAISLLTKAYGYA